MNTKEFAKHIGVSQPLVSKWIKQGVLKKAVKKNGRFYAIDAKIGKAELKKNRDPVRGGDRTKKKTKKTVEKNVGQSAEDTPSSDFDFSKYRTFNEQYKAAKKKLEYEIKIGKYISVDVVERAGFEAGKMIKEQCLAIPDRCAPLVAASSNAFECKKILVKEISYILENLSKALLVIK